MVTPMIMSVCAAGRNDVGFGSICDIKVISAWGFDLEILKLVAVVASLPVSQLEYLWISAVQN